MSPLSVYKKKRSFKKTPEPKPHIAEAGQSLIFVVQKHKARHLHYDLRLELDGVLKSWAVPKGPPKSTQEKRLAIMVEDHPYDYKDFAGVIPAGNYGAGVVEIWDHGTYTVAGATSVDEIQAYMRAGLKKGHVRISLSGTRLKGEYTLVHTSSPKTPNAWLFIKVGKAGEKSSQATTKQSKKIKKDPMPATVKPMLAQLVDKAFNKKDWLFEIKWDGYRAIAMIRNGKVQLLSRNQELFNRQFPQIVDALKEHIKCNAIFDGEIVILDDRGRSQFQLMQGYTKAKKGQLAYYIFDVLYYDGEDLRERPLIERKEKLELLLAPLKKTVIRYSDHIEEQGIKFFKQAVKLELEGIMAKNASSTYQMRRSSDWQKIKTHKRQEVVIGGYTAPKGSRAHFGSLLLGVYEGSALKYIGRVGTGFSDALLKDLFITFKKIKRSTSPFEHVPTIPGTITFLKPILVCEVSFTEWTRDGLLRHPVFLGLRTDKDAREVCKEDS